MGGSGESEVPLSFSPAPYEDARRQGLRAYRFFRTALDAAHPPRLPVSMSGSESGEEASLRELQARTVEALPPTGEDLPLRVLVAVASELDHGELEIFALEPSASDGSGLPASQGLLEWHAAHKEDFRRFFPAECLPGLPEPSEWQRERGSSLIPTLLRITQRFAHATDRHFDSATGLGILLRDWAPELGQMARVLGFSLDDEVPDLLLVRHSADPLEPVLGTYQSLIERLGPGPQAMFVAFGVTAGTPLHERFPDNDLFAAAGLEASPSAGLDPADSVRRHARGDAPTAEDRLGIAPLVEGIRALLDDRRTELPLSIGLTAPWGGGKSSVMFQLRRALGEPVAGRHRTWIPIRFDAWKFERSERIWAALSRAIYEQSQSGMTRRQRIGFKWRLERRRRSAFEFWGGPGLVTALFLAAVALAFLHSSALPGVLAAILVLSGLGALVSRLWGLLSDPFKRALNGYTQNPRYEEELGFTTEAEADIRDLTTLLTAEEDHVLVVFVDDLDRCSPSHLVEAIEAINQIFNAAVYEPQSDAQVNPDGGGRPGRSVFVLGMDREMVAAGIEVAYEATISRLPKARARNFGLNFLAKIIQLSVAVPRPEGTAIAELLERDDTLALRESSGRQPDHLPGPVEAHSVASELERLGRDYEAMLPLGPGIDTTGDGSGEEPLPFDEDSPQFRVAEREAVLHLERNPRDAKRFDNAFRLQLHVAARTPGCALAFDRDDLIAVAKWVAMRLRWPEFADACDEAPGLLDRVEAVANEDAGGVTFEPLTEAEQKWTLDRDLLALLHERRPGCRVGRLEAETFLRIS
jgi:KAP family P-loop domain